MRVRHLFTASLVLTLGCTQPEPEAPTWTSTPPGAQTAWGQPVDAGVWAAVGAFSVKTGLNAAFASSPENLWVAGEHGTAWRWDGVRWARVSLPTDEALVAVWASSNNDVWAFSGAGEILHWNGTHWTKASSPIALATAWGRGPNDLWAAGTSGFLHFDGTKWTLSHASPAEQYVYGMWGTADGSLWAVGNCGYEFALGGGAWSTQVYSPYGEPTLLAIWGVTPVDAWIVGTAGWAGGGPGFILHGAGPHGTAVTPTTLRAAVPQLRAVHGAAANDFWIVGEEGFILHGDGGSVAQIPNDDDAGLRAIWAFDAGDAWAFGERMTMRHWDGAHWFDAAPPVWSASSVRTLAASSGDDLWAGGVGLAHWDGLGWAPMDAGPGDVTALGVRTADDAWVMGPGRPPLHWNGRGWHEVDGGIPPGVTSVWPAGPEELWLVHPEQGVLHWADGGVRTVLEADAGAVAVWGRTPSDVWILGAAVFHWDGSAMRPIAGVEHVNAAWGPAKDPMWLVGDHGGVFRCWGETCAALPLSSSMDFLGVSGRGENDLWLVGRQGTVAWWNGKLHQVPFPWRWDVEGVVAGHGSVWVVGNGQLARLTE